MNDAVAYAKRACTAVALAWIACVAVASAGPAGASPISVRLTIPDAHGTLAQPSGPGLPFTAPSVTFSATADTSAVRTTSNGGYAFAAPIVVSMPGFPDAEVREPASATVSAYNIDATTGRLAFDWGSQPYLQEGAWALDSTLLDYAFRSSYPPTQLAGETWSRLPTGGAVSIRFADGQTGVVAAQSNAGMLTIVVEDEQRNYQGLWWNASAGSESGWGINFAHQGDTIFATWFTYGLDGKARWFVAAVTKTAADTYAGNLYTGTGPAFGAVPFNPAQVVPTQVGAVTLTFADDNNATFAYTVDGVAQSKPVTRQVFGPLPTCAWNGQPNLAAATNYQDLWWVPNGAESGWGVSLTHQGDIIFAAWFTYDFDGSALWLVAAAQRIDAGLYSGTLYRATGPPFNAQPFDPNRVTGTPVGTLTMRFWDGNAGTFTYSMYGVTQTKPITREAFYPPAATVCSDPLASSVTVDSPTSIPWVGELVQLVAVARDAPGFVIPGKVATWASSDPSIASVSSTGVVQGVATGTVAVTATIDGVSDTRTLTVTPMPRISVSVGATKEVVFAYKSDHCPDSDLDFPDLPTHIVRGEDGSLVLFASAAPRYYVSRGADFNSLKRDCSQPVLVSADLPTPQSYENSEWISGVYREGNRWHALISNEFHDFVASTCLEPGPSLVSDCLYLSVTYAVSTDGARTFVKPMAPAHVVAPPPHVWEAPRPGDVPNMGWQFFEGYSGLISIVRNNDGFYYGVVSPRPSKSEPATYQSCTVRTDNLGDPASWRAWDGTGFGFRMVSPYVLGGPAPFCKTSHGRSGLITFNSYFNRFMDLGNYRRTVDGAPVCGLYFSLSADLLHWSADQLITEIRDDGWCPFDPQQPGLLEPVPVMYPTVIDHADTTTNFERPGRTPYLYYVRFNDSWKDRDLVRVPLTFTRQD